jgi:hypothetical protein
MNWRCSQSTPTRFGGRSAAPAARAAATKAATTAAEAIGSLAAFKAATILSDLSIQLTGTAFQMRQLDVFSRLS